MKRFSILLLTLILSLMFEYEAASLDLARLMSNSKKGSLPAAASFEVAFSPSPAAEGAIIRFIGEARFSVHVAAYSFTSKEIAHALMAAARRGVDVRVVADKSNNSQRYTAVTYLANQGIPVRIDSKYAIQHQKVTIVDGVAVQTGSYNYTASARDRNSENILILRNVPDLAGQYESNWRKMWEESTPMPARY